MLSEGHLPRSLRQMFVTCYEQIGHWSLLRLLNHCYRIVPNIMDCIFGQIVQNVCEIVTHDLDVHTVLVPHIGLTYLSFDFTGTVYKIYTGVSASLIMSRPFLMHIK